jgi:hypothetical protein
MLPNALEPASALGIPSPVRVASRPGNKAQVLAPIVERVKVFMVNNFSVILFASHDKTM